MTVTTARDIAVALGRGKEKSHGPGRGWNTFCPSHDDRNMPSLSVTDGREGKILVRCHAGCTGAEVVQALRDRGLWPSGSRKNWVAQKYAPEGRREYGGDHHPKLGKPSKWWAYFDLSGKIRGSVARFEEKLEDGSTGKVTLPVTWCREQTSAEERWWFKGFPEPRSPYRERSLAEHPKRHVLVVEGEKTAEAAQHLVGDTYVVLTWQGGAKAVKRTDWSSLKGRDVTLWPDADGVGDQAMRELAEILIQVGAKVVRRVNLPEDLERGWDLADDIPGTLDVVRLLHGATQYVPLGDEVVERFNRKFALTLLGGQSVVLEEDQQRGTVSFLSVTGFKEFYGNREVISGKSKVPESTYWLKHPERRSFRSVTFKPAGETPGHYNLWRGFSHEPDPTGSWEMLREHVVENIARGDESIAKWVLGWFAQIVQHPDKKLGTSLAVRGKQGTGKTLLGEVMGRLYRPHYVLVDKPHYVVGQFNAHMSSCILLHADEAFFAGNPANVGMLRGLVTSDVLRVEHKGKDSVELPNYLRLYASSNNSWVVPAGFEERRFAALDVGDGRMQDRVWFAEMLRELEDGGYAALLHDLMNFDLTSVDVSSVPQTGALQDQKLHSLDTVTKFLFEVLHAGEVRLGAAEWPEHVVLADLHADYVEACIKWGESRRLDQHSFSRELKKFWPVPIEQKRVSRSKSDPRKGQRPWAIATGTLPQHRARFQEVLGGEVEWGGETTI